jgi:Protein of unknown function, DUF488
MTTLFTSSFVRWRPEHGQPVSIALRRPTRLIPETATWPQCWPVTPRWSYFRAPHAEFDEAYVAQLDRYGAAYIAKALQQIARQTGAERLVLCCYEPRPGACHRGLLSAWVLLGTGEKIEEVTP